MTQSSPQLTAAPPPPQPRQSAFSRLQEIGKALMLPVAVLPAAGILLGLGAALNDKSYTWYDSIPEWLHFVGKLMVGASDVIFGNLPIIFAMGVAVGLSGGAGVAALAALVGFLVMNSTMSAWLGLGDAEAFAAAKENQPGGYANVLGIPTLQTGVFGGIIMGILAAWLYNRYKDIRLPQWLGFFAGRRFVPIVTAASAIFLGIALTFLWPPVQQALNAFSNFAVNEQPTLAAGLFGFINRLLIPFGLHHIWYQPFWFIAGEYTNPATGEIVHGDMTRYLAGDRSAGTFMTGFFPIMGYALPAAALAIYQEARPERKAAVGGIMVSAALTSFLTGITEPIEFAFMFVAPVLYVFHAAMTGLSFMLMHMFNVHAGFTFSGGFIDYMLLWPKSTNAILVPLFGLAFAAIYYTVFRFLIRKMNLATPGREVEEAEAVAAGPAVVPSGEREEAVEILRAFGGPNNIQNLDACITRLRVTVNDKSQVSKARLQQLGAAGVLEMGNSVQAVYGTRSDRIKETMQQVIAEGGYTAAPVAAPMSAPVTATPAAVVPQPAVPQQAVSQPVAAPRLVPTQDPVSASLPGLPSDWVMPLSGRMVPLSAVPDEVFSSGMMGQGFAIEPDSGEVRSPVTGEVVTLFPTHHAIGLRADNGLEVLVHVGVDTVNLQGEGFVPLVKQGDRVTAGQTLLRADLNAIRSRVPSLVTPVLFTNLDDSQRVELDGEGRVRIH
ncbi:PTS system glucose-specific EIICBA component [Deinococcus piscis]|uniref:PTS system glucose-specific EIICBA component n=1 Tax=Deinococcus piscis TaxID=394230 RepID=A0ABQ3JZA5_9DEIO|nr:glucose-specific PTS transporter subunit IIBC [Deinococcus piscis]GHF94638.1 PTS system glucose-specific EIICBA component [Deinococcus piscis]